MYKVSANHNAPKESYLHFKTSAVKFFNVRRQSVEKCGRQRVEKCGGTGLNLSDVMDGRPLRHDWPARQRPSVFLIRSVLPTAKTSAKAHGGTSIAIEYTVSRFFLELQLQTPIDLPRNSGDCGEFQSGTSSFEAIG